jgi:hypothetical protein
MLSEAECSLTCYLAVSCQPSVCSFSAGHVQSYLIMAGIKEELGLSAVPPAALLFIHRTIAALAATLISRASGSAAELPLCVAHSWPSSTRPLSGNQQQMWWLRELAGATAYNVPMMLSLSGAIDATLLQQALNLVAARHEVLRMHYEDQGDGLVGVVMAADAAAIKLERTSVNGPLHTVVAALQHEVGTAFDLAVGAPVRAVLLSSSSSAHVLGIVMHHIAGDGWSVNLLWKELSLCYTALIDGRQPQLPPLPVQYSDYAAWQQEVLASDHAAQWRSYWREALLGAPALLQLPCDRPRPAERTYAGGTLFAELPLALEAQLDRLTAAQGVNMQAALLGILQVTN